MFLNIKTSSPVEPNVAIELLVISPLKPQRLTNQLIPNSAPPIGKLLFRSLGTKTTFPYLILEVWALKQPFLI